MSPTSHVVGAEESVQLKLEPRPTHGLPRTAIVSPEIFEVEQDRIFSRHWLSVLGSAEVLDPGSCRAVDLPRRPIMLVRGQDGTLRGFDNVCRHRGCRIVETTTSRHAGALRCPYHGWTYRENGDLVVAPNVDAPLLGDANSLGLKAFQVDVAAEQVFVHFSSAVANLGEWLRPLNSIIAPWFQRPLSCGLRVEYDIQANWKLVFQNFNECYHCRFVHPGLNALTRFDTASNDLLEGPILGGPMVLSDGVQSMTTHSRYCSQPFASLDKQQVRRVFYFTLFPNLFVSPHPDYVMVHRLIPVSPTRTQIQCEFLFDRELCGADAFDPSPAAEFWDEVNREDWDVCERTQAGVESLAYEPGPYSSAESMVAEFDRYYRTMMRGVELNSF